MGKRKKKVVKVSICAGIVLLLVVIVVANLKKQSSGIKSEQDDPVQVKKGTIVDKLTETGEIRFARTVEVESEISGRVKQLLADEGDQVEKGKLLAIIEPDPDQLLRLYSKRTNRDQALINLRDKERELERQRALFGKGHISREAVEQAEDTWRLADNSYKQALLELRILEKEMGIDSSSGKPLTLSESGDFGSPLKLADHQVLSPIAGIIIARQIEEGEMVVSGTSSLTEGTVLFRIGDPSRMIVISKVSEVDISRIVPGQEVKILVDAYPEESFAGQVTKIAPAGYLSKSNVIVFNTEIEIESTDNRLKQGMSCDADIIVERKNDVLYLPIEAVAKIYKRDEQDEETNEVEKTVVFIKTDKDYEEREVTIGIESSMRVEIITGLSEGDNVHPNADKIRKEREEKQKKEKEDKSGKGKGNDIEGEENEKGREGEEKKKE